MAAGLPLLPPYKHMGTWFGNRVNFAVAGSTALSSEALAAHNVTNPVTNSSLSVQLDWMDSYFNSTNFDEIGKQYISFVLLSTLYICSRIINMEYLVW